MNEAIIQRTNKKLEQNQKIGNHQWLYKSHGIVRKYLILKNVFSPAIFLGTQWLTQKVVQLCKNQYQVLQIGCGCGVTSIQIWLVHKCKILACDINQYAILNTQANKKQFNAQIQILKSDMFQQISQKKFDIIYWNFPFHPSQQIQNITYLQRAVKDPGYKMLRLFLSKGRQFLKSDGKILLGFSLTMGDKQKLQQLAIEFGWQCQVIDKMHESTICLIEIK